MYPVLLQLLLTILLYFRLLIKTESKVNCLKDKRAFLVRFLTIQRVTFMRFLQTQYLEKYNRKQRYTLQKHFKKPAESGRNSSLPFSFYITASSTYSSLIEGSKIDEATYMQYKEVGR